VIETTALIRALENGRIRGAALDVLENEDPVSIAQMTDPEFLRLTSDARVLVTPHIAGYSEESPLKMSRTILKKLGIPEA
jgi:D-3-phosphoglycerate dehydrogenase